MGPECLHGPALALPRVKDSGQELPVLDGLASKSQSIIPATPVRHTGSTCWHGWDCTGVPASGGAHRRPSRGWPPHALYVVPHGCLSMPIETNPFCLF